MTGKGFALFNLSIAGAFVVAAGAVVGLAGYVVERVRKRRSA